MTPEEIAADAAKKEAADAARRALESDPEKLKERLAYIEAEAKKAFQERDEERKARKALEDAERGRKEAELTEVEKLKAQADKLKKELEASEKKAQEWDTFQTARREELKKELGDKWDDKFGSLSLEGMEILKAKFVADRPPTPGTKPGSSGERFYTLDEIKKMSQSEVSLNLTKVNESLAHWGRSQ